MFLGLLYTQLCREVIKSWTDCALRASAWVYQRGPPRILRPVDGAASSGEVGQTVQLSCEAFALPVPEGMVGPCPTSSLV